MAIEIIFEPERETKRTWRYQEVVEDAAEPIVGQVYVPKTTLAELGADGGRLRMTIEAESVEER